MEKEKRIPKAEIWAVRAQILMSLWGLSLVHCHERPDDAKLKMYHNFDSQSAAAGLSAQLQLQEDNKVFRSFRQPINI